ncbi:biogenesis of lysosome-related organelles complex 1 subunit 1-like isoform X1 [Scyliorhinus torazame]|uniref:biogenesis of lysosome-related organelles complex 1 subunit 1-like isoform X1 n=1 Tax=Scyliorhinus torazame TaxID=75743 RepID=UPI003B5C91D2
MAPQPLDPWPPPNACTAFDSGRKPEHQTRDRRRLGGPKGLFLSWIVCSFTRRKPTQTRVAQAYVNQRKLDNEVKTLQIQAAQFAKQTQQWLGMVDSFNQALKEIGDVENWARSIEMDMRTIATALEYVYKGQLQPAT